jgi:hypothetical protein
MPVHALDLFKRMAKMDLETGIGVLSLQGGLEIVIVAVGNQEHFHRLQ